MNAALARKAVAEGIGTAFLVAAVVGSGIAAQRLSPGNVGLQLLENSIATGAVLVGLILALQPVSAAFNPIVTLVERALGAIDTATAAVLIAAQVIGAMLGLAANAMFSLDAISVSTKHRSGGGHWLAEVIATLGLLLVIFGLAHAGRDEKVAYAVAGYITAAYWFTSSTSFATLPSRSVASSAIPSPASPRHQCPGSSSPSSQAERRRATCSSASCSPPHDVTRPTSPPPTPEASGVSMSYKPSVLFVCVHNAGRSQMAQGWLRQLAGDKVEVYSAGSEPAEQINPVAVEAMREVGIDITAEQPKILGAVSRADVVITMGCGDTCLYFPGKRYEDWDLTDAAGQPIEIVRQVRDELHDLIQALVTDLVPA